MWRNNRSIKQKDQNSGTSNVLNKKEEELSIKQRDQLYGYKNSVSRQIKSNTVNNEFKKIDSN
jgi:hypothetical protein